MHSALLSLPLLVAGVAAQAENLYTATATSDVAAAKATAKTSSPTSNVKGHAFNRFVTIWLENTDYDLAAGDRMLSQRGSPIAVVVTVN
jgi:hypothetical protein